MRNFAHVNSKESKLEKATCVRNLSLRVMSPNIRSTLLCRVSRGKRMIEESRQDEDICLLIKHLLKILYTSF